MMKRYGQRMCTVIIVILVITSLLAAASPVQAASVITVTTTADGIANDGKCSLREAVIAANENRAVGGCPAGGAGTDTIIIPKNPNVSTFYQVTLGSGDDTARVGDLDILDSLIIAGAGPGQTTIAAAGSDRVFHLVKLNTKFVRIQNLTITKGGNVTHGGGIYNQGSRLELVNVTITNNRTITSGTADTTGGGVSNIISTYVPSLTITNSTIKDNTSKLGGGIYSEGPLRIERSLISGNTATIAGGGLDNNPQPGNSGTIINSTITNNSASDAAGIAIYGPLQIFSSTIYNNNGYGLQLQKKGTLSLKNTIIAGHPLPFSNCKNNSDYLSSALVSNGNNMADDTTCGLNKAGDKINDPLLSPLAYYGGPTMTFALPEASPAVDAGSNTDCPPSDQRMYARPADGGIGLTCDIGAFEYNGWILKLFLPAINR